MVEFFIEVGILVVGLVVACVVTFTFDWFMLWLCGDCTYCCTERELERYRESKECEKHLKSTPPQE
jgi:hypothetical protein